MTRALLLLAALAIAFPAWGAEYTFLRTPRCGDGLPETVETLHPMCGGVERVVRLPAAPGPLRLEYTQLVAYDEDTRELRVLVDPGEGNAVLDAVPGLDGRTVFYSFCLGVQRSGDIPTGGCHIESIDSQTLERRRLITGGLHLSPREYQPGKLVYQWHGADGFRAAGLKVPSWQLAIYDIATGAGEIIGHQSIGSVLHPFPLTNGAIAFNSLENQGLRGHELWGIWSQFPDGRHWKPEWSAYTTEHPNRATRTRHFAEQLGGGRIVVAQYYEDFTIGLGSIFEFAPAERDIGRPIFGSWVRSENSPIVGNCSNGGARVTYDTTNFAPHGVRNVTPFAQNADAASCKYDGEWEGKVTHPAPDLNGGMLMTLCVGPCLGQKAPLPHPDTEIARLSPQPQFSGGAPILEPATTHRDLGRIYNDTAWLEWYPRVLASYQAIYGQAAPDTIPFLPRSPRARPGDPVGWIGSSSTCHADVITSHDVDRDGNVTYPRAWTKQGIDPPFDCASVVGMRLFAFEPTQLRGSGFRWQQLARYNQERTWILGEVPIEADGSWLAMVPADVSIGFGPINAAGDMLVPPATWKKVAPGEDRHDCGGCHAHSKHPVPWETSAAAAATYSPHDVAYQTPLMEAMGTVSRSDRAVTVEWVRDIQRLFVGQTWDQVTAQVRKLGGDKPEHAVIDSSRSPLVTSDAFLSLSEPDQRQVRRWIGIGAPRDLPTPVTPHRHGGKWYLDEYPPTVTMEVADGRLYVGAYDLHDQTVVPEVMVRGAVLALTEIDPGRRWVTDAPPAGSLVTVRAGDATEDADGQPSSNVRVIARVVGESSSPPTEPPECPAPVACPVPRVVECPVDGICLLEVR